MVCPQLCGVGSRAEQREEREEPKKKKKKEETRENWDVVGSHGPVGGNIRTCGAFAPVPLLPQYSTHKAARNS